jgi:uncharacterized Fe-S cluster-containing MiaB family protein
MARKSVKKKDNVEDKEVSAAIKTFKATQEVEDLYQYIHDNKLRAEAHVLIKTVLESMQPKRRRKAKILQ